MTDIKEKALERKLIFLNLVNGNPVPIVAQAFHRSESEINAEFNFVIQKIKSYMFERAMPFLACATITEARQNRLRLFDIVEKLNLESIPIYSKIENYKLEDVIR